MTAVEESSSAKTVDLVRRSPRKLTASLCAVLICGRRPDKASTAAVEERASDEAVDASRRDSAGRLPRKLSVGLCAAFSCGRRPGQAGTAIVDEPASVDVLQSAECLPHKVSLGRSEEPEGRRIANVSVGATVEARTAMNGSRQGAASNDGESDFELDQRIQELVVTKPLLLGQSAEAEDLNNDADDESSLPKFRRGRLSTRSERRLRNAAGEQELPAVPIDENGLPTSVGSYDHYSGKCRPCMYANTARGCSWGLECDFCHFPHTQRRRSLSKGARPVSASVQCRPHPITEAMLSLSDHSIAQRDPHVKPNVVLL